jgi:hypothetical protein
MNKELLSKLTSINSEEEYDKYLGSIIGKIIDIHLYINKVEKEERLTEKQNMVDMFFKKGYIEESSDDGGLVLTQEGIDEFSTNELYSITMEGKIVQRILQMANN